MPSTEINSSSLLTEDFNTGGRRGFAELFRMYAPAIYGYLQRVAGDKQIAEQLLQETFVAVWNDWAVFEQSKKTIFVWILQKAKTVALSAGRQKSSKTQNHEPTFFVTNRVCDSIADECVVEPQQVNEAPSAAMVFELIHFQKCSPQEIANCLHITPEAVKILLRNAMKGVKSLPYE